MLVEGVRGPDRERWCQCGWRRLEILGEWYSSSDGIAVDDVVEYSHNPKCPVCADDERTLRGRKSA